MYFIGDVHGQFKTYDYIINKMQVKGGGIGVDQSLQIGDLGLFGADDASELDDIWVKNKSPMDQKFFRGNHDNPELCNYCPNHLADWDFLEKQNMFVFAGGVSLDKYRRTQYINWWPEEQQSQGEALKALDSYSKNKPAIMVSHECPTVIKSHILEVCRQRLKLNKRWSGVGPSHTELALQEMYNIHKPEVWIFGHYHVKMDIELEGIRFICLDAVHFMREQSYFELEGLSW